MVKKFFPIPLLLIALFPISLLAQFQYSGSIYPSGMFHIDDASDISLPFRLAEAQMGYTFANIDLVYSGALEYRWSNSRDARIDSREFYLAWYPDWGEFRLGRQIIIWGVVDGNNPTDNVNPYDYYYLFSPGAERKIGTFLGALTYYWNDWSIQGVVIPEHNPNRMVYDEEDFPISLPIEPEKLANISNPMEFGLRTSGIFGETDFSFTYFYGYDRDYFSVGLISPIASELYPDFGFRSAQMFGIDFVRYFGELGVRGEGAFFITESNDETGEGSYTFLFNKAEYFQYVIQTEWTAPFDILINTQLIGNETISTEGETFNIITSQVLPLTKSSFQPGIGTPFAMFSDLALMLSASSSYLDDRLDIDIFSLINLEDAGLMLGCELSYSQFDNLKLELGVSQFIGNDDPSNPFTLLEEFSHFRLGLKYSF